MDENDGALSDNLNKLSLNSVDDDYGAFSINHHQSPFDSSIDLNNKNGFDLYEPDENDPLSDTTDSVHRDIFSKLSLR